MSKHGSITLSLMDLKTWFVVAMVISFGVAVLAGIMHREYASHERQQQQEQNRRYEKQRLREVQADQKKLDEFRY